MKKFNFILGVALVCCSFFSYSCEVKMQGVTFFDAQDGATYKLSLNIQEVCSSRLINRREIKNTQIDLYKNNKLIASEEFESGLWYSDSGRVLLENNKSKASKCFKNINSINLNLKKNTLNSLDGMYLNLKNGTSYNWKCS